MYVGLFRTVLMPQRMIHHADEVAGGIKPLPFLAGKVGGAIS